MTPLESLNLREGMSLIQNFKDGNGLGIGITMHCSSSQYDKEC